MTLLEATRRANSNITYWRYRRSIGRPIALMPQLRQWWQRLLFELRENNHD